MRASVVIGSNFGDEGKGITTDYIASTGRNSLVVRFNGGAQAGHTVELSDGRKHVFSHFGSGTMAGAHTYLSKHFIVNPSFFQEELESLIELGLTPHVFVDNRAIVTTPIDVMINRAIELSRGVDRHGSVGLGINETVTRSFSDTGSFAITALDLTRGPEYLVERLYDIEQNYLVDRLEELGLDREAVQWKDARPLIDDWLAAVESFIFGVTLIESPKILQDFGYDVIVFEGAQGLLLDEDHEYFPHVTRSKTGLNNAYEVATEMGFITSLDVHYVTRPYMTRHGAGPFPTHVDGMQLKDDTNVRNDWQESMRFGKLDVNAWAKEVLKDLEPFTASILDPWIGSVVPVLTWFGHDGEHVDILYHGEARVSYVALSAILAFEIGSVATLIFTGRTRESAALLYAAT